MKVLNFEDSVYKANAIRKILGNRCGVASVEQVSETSGTGTFEWLSS